MNVQIAYAPLVKVNRVGNGEYAVIDPTVNRKVGHVSVIRGFLHYEGIRRTAHEGVSAVIAPSSAEGPNHVETIERVLTEGLRGGRDDRR